VALFLFDIDNTLVNTGGAGGKAMNLAFRDLFGIENGFQGVEFSGRTDTAIFRDALRLRRIPEDEFPALLRRFEDAYAAHLAHTLTETEGRVLPGIPQVVATLAGTRGVRVGLATGNFRRGAMLKLEYYGLSTHLREGGFGEDSEDRAQVVALAVQRLEGDGSRTTASRRAGRRPSVFVVGDTPLDVEAALANGFAAVGVATGRNSMDDLRAAGAGLVFPDFGDVDDVLRELLGEAGVAPS